MNRSNQIPFQWVASNEKLAEICEQARQKPAVALDTEFIRTRSFYPKLGLIQLYDGQNVSLIDPLEISYFTPFSELLADRNVTKVLHSCSEDLEVFSHYFKQLPTPLFDTQIVAHFLGLGASLGFAKLVEHFLNVSIDKGASRTDWLLRPLSDSQLEYAAADVWYLLPIFEQLNASLAQSNWKQAAMEDCETLLQKRTKDVDTNKLYKEIGNAWKLAPKELAILQVLAKWRYEEAVKRDLALNFVVKEQHLWQIAKEQPIHTSQLAAFMHPNEIMRHGKKLLWLVARGQSVATENQPKAISRMVDDPQYKKALKQLQEKLVEITPADLPSELIASKRQLNQLFSWYKKGGEKNTPELLTGWRTPFGEQMLQELQQIIS